MKLNVREMAVVSMFAALACIPGLLLRFGVEGVVPFSLLPFIAMLSGLVLGSKLGALSMVVYMLIGLMGVPVFSVSPYGGLSYLIKPTAGFVFGFIATAYVAGKITEIRAGKNLVTFVIASCAGLVVLYLVGLPYLYIILNYLMGKAVDVAGVLKIGFIPFIGFDLLKALAASVIAVPVTRQVRFFAPGAGRR